MIRGKELEKQAYESDHIACVLAEMSANFPTYWSKFAEQPVAATLAESIEAYEKERQRYRDYLAMDALEEWEYDPNAFKSYTGKEGCPIIHRCLMSPDEVMKAYRKSFYATSGRQILDAVRHIAEFGLHYVTHFDDSAHERASKPADLGLDALNQAEYGCVGVVGYGVQSSLLYGLYAREFAHRSQAAVWSLYFLSGRKDFGLADGSEFLMANPDLGTCEQNFFYPAELFGFYALQVWLMLKSACTSLGINLLNSHRYAYLSVFCSYVGEIHQDDINTFRWSSEHVESQRWF